MKEVIDYYTQHPERSRLAKGWGLLEFARTQQLLKRHLPPTPSIILDVGGGNGVWSEWLGTLGYETHLLDLVPGHVEAAGQSPHIASSRVGDARSLPYLDGSAGAVLLLGPLYHLLHRSERLKALSEARRVLRPGGLLIASAICRFAPLLASLLEGFFDDPKFAPVLRRDLDTGCHYNTTGDPRRFTTAYFHRPEELRAEMEAAGFSMIAQSPVEGAAWLACGSETGFTHCWADPERRAALLELIQATENDSMSLSISPHFIAVGSA